VAGFFRGFEDGSCAHEQLFALTVYRLSESLRAPAVRDGCGWPASAPRLRAIQRIGDAGIGGSAPGIAAVIGALNPSCESATDGN
jgi:hypothetical protein